MRGTDIVAYAYRADLYCPNCMLTRIGGKSADGRLVEEALDNAAATLEVDRHDERTFDSDEFPKVVFRDQFQTDDRCAGCSVLLHEVPSR